MKKQTKKKIIWSLIGLGAVVITGIVLYKQFEKDLDEALQGLDFTFDEPADDFRHDAR